MDVTCDVSQLLKSQISLHPLNVPTMDVTCDVSQSETSQNIYGLLNVLTVNNWSNTVTLEISSQFKLKASTLSLYNCCFISAIILVNSLKSFTLY